MIGEDLDYRVHVGTRFATAAKEDIIFYSCFVCIFCPMAIAEQLLGVFRF